MKDIFKDIDGLIWSTKDPDIQESLIWIKSRLESKDLLLSQLLKCLDPTGHNKAKRLVHLTKGDLK